MEGAFRLAVIRFPNVDSAIMANMAERLAKNIAGNIDSIGSVRRYAYSAMLGVVRDWLRSRAAREVTVGSYLELDRYVEVNNSFQRRIDRTILFQQLKLQLSDRDRYILIPLLKHNVKTEDVALELGISDDAARKAIQRARERMAKCLEVARPEKDTSPEISGTKGLTREWI